jgi:hypothetical protein
VEVENLSMNMGSRTPGIDGMSLNNRETLTRDKMQLLEFLREMTYKPNRYIASPVKRIYIPKAV